MNTHPKGWEKSGEKVHSLSEYIWQGIYHGKTLLLGKSPKEVQVSIVLWQVSSLLVSFVFFLLICYINCTVQYSSTTLTTVTHMPNVTMAIDFFYIGQLNL